jgi:hypothetical protein
MTSGANDLGDRGCCFGDPDRELFAVWGFDDGVVDVFAWACELALSSIAISAFSSNAGPDMHDSMLSPNTCCRQLFPGALIDRSCRGGRPGIVADRDILLVLTQNVLLTQVLTRIHGDFLNRRHRT